MAGLRLRAGAVCESSEARSVCLAVKVRRGVERSARDK
jgi:hypothetical protein